MEIALAYDVYDHRFLLFAKGVHAAGALETGAPGIADREIVDLLPFLVAAALVMVVPVMDVSARGVPVMGASVQGVPVSVVPVMEASARGVPVRNFPVTRVPEKDVVQHLYYSADLAELRLGVDFQADV